jgi:hypothetical protein
MTVILYMILAWFSVNVAVFDEFDLIPYIATLHEGGLTWEKLWLPHNQHRITLLRLVAMGLAALGGWHVVKEMLVSWFCAAALLTVYWFMLKHGVSQTARLWLLASGAFLIFSPVQYDNWGLGFQFVWFLNNFLLGLVIFLQNRYPGKLWCFGLLIFLTVLANLSVGTGLAFLPIVLIVFLFRFREWNWQYSVVWSVFSLLVALVYFSGNTQGQGGTGEGALQQPGVALMYFFTMLGAPFVSWSIPLAFFAGLLSFGLICGFSLSLIKQLRRAQFVEWRGTLPWLQLIAFGVVNSAISSNSRLYLGVNNALLSRYTTATLMFWLGLLVFGYIVGSTYYKAAKPRERGRLLALTGFFGLILIGLYITTYIDSWQWSERRGYYLSQLVPFVYSYRTAPDDVFLLMQGDAAVVRKGLAVLERHREGLFADPAQLYFSKLERDWEIERSRLYAEPSAETRYKVLNSNAKLSGTSGQGVNFERRLAEFVTIEYDLGGEKPELLELKVGKAAYIRLYWNTGGGYNFGDRVTLIASSTESSQKEFRARVPKNVQKFVLEIFYEDATILKDKLQITAYTAQK